MSQMMPQQQVIQQPEPALFQAYDDANLYIGFQVNKAD